MPDHLSPRAGRGRANGAGEGQFRQYVCGEYPLIPTFSAHAGRTSAAGQASTVVIPDHAARDQPVPDEQNHERPDRGGDEAGTLVRAVMADRLAYPSRQECPGNAEYGGEDEAARVVGTGRQHPRDDAGNEADHDDPDDSAHNDSLLRKLKPDEV